jgi:hypothetical protein
MVGLDPSYVIIFPVLIINMKFTIVITILVVAFGCNLKNNSDERQTTSDSVYFYQPVGWRMKVPNNYEILTQEDQDKLNERGLKEMQEAVGEFEPEPVTNLINFRKDQFNVFLSTSQVMDSLEAPYEEVHNNVVDILLDTYRNNNIKVDHKRDYESIDGKRFITDQFVIMTADEKVIMTQLMFSRLFGNIELSATISWNKEELGNEMLEHWRNSEFKP